MKITIIYDNTAAVEELTADWGFACLIEFGGKNILFDTGARGDILLGNMENGGLSDILKINNPKLYIPKGYDPPEAAKNVIKVTGSVRIAENIHSTGVLENIEQSLIVKTAEGPMIIAGCSHPGVGNILKAVAIREVFRADRGISRL